jgi:thioredoxin 1
MNAPYEQITGPVEVVSPPTVTPGNNAAKLSIIAAVTVIGLNWAGITVFHGRSAALTVSGIAALVAVWAGVLAAVVGLVRAWNCPGKSVIPLALAGLLLNGSLLATGAPILGRQDAGPNKLSAEELDARPLSAQSNRTIVTKDWTAGFAIELTDRNFDEVINGYDVPVLVDFWAPWCGPCRMMSPVIEELAERYEGKARVCKLNVDNAPETAAKFSVSAIPTIILFKKGRVQKQWVGITSSQTISSAIDKRL